MFIISYRYNDRDYYIVPFVSGFKVSIERDDAFTFSSEESARDCIQRQLHPAGLSHTFKVEPLPHLFPTFTCHECGNVARAEISDSFDYYCDACAEKIYGQHREEIEDDIRADGALAVTAPLRAGV